jgi:hypothetical protein
MPILVLIYNKKKFDMINSQLPIYTQKDIKAYLIANGCSGTIYALAFPESRKIFEEVIDGGDRNSMIKDALNSSQSPESLAIRIKKLFETARQNHLNIYEGAWTGRQDHVDQDFFNTWRQWSAPVLTTNNSQWNHMYPTSGASEGLRESINAYGADARANNYSPTIHVFTGEYEGFKAYADAAKINVVTHNRNNWKESLSKVSSKDQFYISQPSAIDGNIWDEFDEFARALDKQQPDASLMLDVTYLGSVAKDYHINADHPNIPRIFFSLSKPFGVYYHRIGGVISRESMQGLFGNAWFKNIQSIRLGTALLERSASPQELPQKYQTFRDEALATISKKIGVTLTASDVLLFATAPSNEADTDIKKSLLRGSLGEQFIRVCLTPQMAKIIPNAVYIENDGQFIEPSNANTGAPLGELKL